MGRELLVMISDPVFSPFSSYQQGASNDSQGSVFLHLGYDVCLKPLRGLRLRFSPSRKSNPDLGRVKKHLWSQGKSLGMRADIH